MALTPYGSCGFSLVKALHACMQTLKVQDTLSTTQGLAPLIGWGKVRPGKKTIVDRDLKELCHGIFIHFADVKKIISY